MLIDNTTILTGSFNFTKATEEGNAENFLVIQDPALAARYTKHWHTCDEHSDPYPSKLSHHWSKHSHGHRPGNLT